MDDTTTAVSTELNFSATPEPTVVVAEPQVVKIHGKLDRNGVAIGTGRRKTAVARVAASLAGVPSLWLDLAGTRTATISGSWVALALAQPWP